MGYLILALSYILYGASDAAGPLAYRLGSDANTLSLCNCLMPLPFVAGTLLLTRGRFRVGRRAFFMALLLGVFVGATALTLNMSYLMISVGVGTTLHMAHTLVASLGEAAIERRRPRLGTFLALILVIGGVACLSGCDLGGASSKLGMGIALFSGLTFGCVTLLAGHGELTKLTSLQTQFYSLLSASFVLIIFNLLTRPTLIPDIPARAWGIHVFCAVTTNYVALALALWGIRRAGSTAGSIMGAVEPISCAAFGAFWLDERLTGPILIGALLILIGVVVEPATRLRSERGSRLVASAVESEE